MNIFRYYVTFMLIILAGYIGAQESKTTLINLNSPENSETTFNDIIKQFDGKVIYLDFWASWCRPCKNEMPHSTKLKKELANEDVVFIYISSDRDANAWKKAIKELNITGYNYLTSANIYNQYNSLYNVKYIPRYVLFNKKGKAVDVNAKRPSNPETLKDIKKLLAE